MSPNMFAKFRFMPEYGKVQRRIDYKVRKHLFGVGRYIKNAMQWSLPKVSRRKWEVSDAGSPPFSRLGTVRRSIRFDVNMNTKTVLIGPQFYRSRAVVPMNAPSGVANLEYGGSALFLKNDKRPEYTAFIRPRPFVEPQRQPAEATFEKFLAKDGLT